METEKIIKQASLDHDLLVRIDEKINLLLTDNKDHELRIRKLEFWGAIAVGLSYALQFYFKFLK